MESDPQILSYEYASIVREALPVFVTRMAAGIRKRRSYQLSRPTARMVPLSQ